MDLNYFNLQYNNIKPKKGNILISEPFSDDIYFSRSVILLCEYSIKGGIGFILNKPINAKLQDLFEDFPDFDTQLCLGGPVHTDTIYYIHTLGKRLPDSSHIYDNLYWGGDFDTLKMMIKAKEVKPNEIRFFLGYSGWNPNQLEEELEKNYWLVSSMKPNDIMVKNQTDIWGKAIEKFNGKYKIWKNFPINPNQN